MRASRVCCVFLCWCWACAPGSADGGPWPTVSLHAIADGTGDLRVTACFEKLLGCGREVIAEPVWARAGGVTVELVLRAGEYRGAVPGADSVTLGWAGGEISLDVPMPYGLVAPSEPTVPRRGILHVATDDREPASWNAVTNCREGTIGHGFGRQLPDGASVDVIVAELAPSGECTIRVWAMRTHGVALDPATAGYAGTTMTLRELASTAYRVADR